MEKNITATNTRHHNYDKLKYHLESLFYMTYTGFLETLFGKKLWRMDTSYFVPFQRELGNKGEVQGNP